LLGSKVRSKRKTTRPQKYSIGITRRFVIPSIQPYKKPLNYLEYKKDFDLNVHVRVFKFSTKVNGKW
jgi:hypothetical protein